MQLLQPQWYIENGGLWFILFVVFAEDLAQVFVSQLHMTESFIELQNERKWRGCGCCHRHDEAHSSNPNLYWGNTILKAASTSSPIPTMTKQLTIRNVYWVTSWETGSRATSNPIIRRDPQLCSHEYFINLYWAGHNSRWDGIVKIHCVKHRQWNSVRAHLCEWS